MTLTTGDYDEVRCAHCGGGNMHINAVAFVAGRDSRRDAFVRVRLWCEHCPELTEVVLTEHEGCTYASQEKVE